MSGYRLHTQDIYQATLMVPNIVASYAYADKYARKKKKMGLKIYLTAKRVNLPFLSILLLINKTLGKRINKFYLIKFETNVIQAGAGDKYSIDLK